MQAVSLMEARLYPFWHYAMVTAVNAELACRHAEDADISSYTYQGRTLEHLNKVSWKPRQLFLSPDWLPWGAAWIRLPRVSTALTANLVPYPGA